MNRSHRVAKLRPLYTPRNSSASASYAWMTQRVMQGTSAVSR